MRVIFTKGNEKHGYLKCIRSDGSTTEAQMPEQGVAPHDMIHLIVERTLNFSGAFYGQIKFGANINFTMEHNETSRSTYSKTETWQTESIVESIQSLLWSKSFEYADLLYLVEQTCTSRNIAMPVISENHFSTLKLKLLDLNMKWKSMSQGETISEQF